MKDARGQQGAEDRVTTRPEPNSSSHYSTMAQPMVNTFKSQKGVRDAFIASVK
jgi:hypothetical protein